MIITIIFVVLYLDLKKCRNITIYAKLNLVGGMFCRKTTTFRFVEQQRSLKGLQRHLL